MIEYLSEAIVMKREPYAEQDGRFWLFTKKFGKLVVRGRSTRKITSKLAGHLGEGNLVRARLIEKNGLQVVDALKEKTLPVSFADLLILETLLPEAIPEAELWELLLEPSFNWNATLKILGWDPQEAVCRNCGKRLPEYFLLRSQEFGCKNCIATFRVRQSEVLLL